MLLFRYSDNNRLHLGIIIVMNIHNLQSRLMQQTLPFRLRALDRTEGRHHRDVQISRLPRHPGIRQDDFVDDDARIRAEGRNGGLEDFDAIGFGPVVQNVTEIVEFGFLDGLRLEEIVHEEFDAVDGLGLIEGRGDVLNDDPAGEIREFGFDGYGLLAEATAYVD